MNKLRQKELQQWLKLQHKPIRKWLYFNILLGTISAVFIIFQMGILAKILHQLIELKQISSQFILLLLLLFICFVARGLLVWIRERVGFKAGRLLRQHLREKILDKLVEIGPMSIEQQPAGSWSILIMEQVENLHNFYSRYLPQQFLSMIVPLVILCAVFPFNWAAGTILFLTLPLLPLFMALAGLKAVEANQRNIVTLSRLSGQFLDQLKGLETSRLFGQTENQIKQIYQRTEAFRLSTMDVLKMAFLSSAVLEFFTAISIAVMAVYFGFSYLKELNFGDYSLGISLFVGFFCLMLAPEFYQPLRELGTYYHDKAAAIATADNIEKFFNQKTVKNTQEEVNWADMSLCIQAVDCIILSPQGFPLSKSLNFTIKENQRIALIGQSGAGKSSLMNLLLGFLPYRGSITVNGIELNALNMNLWRKNLAWVGQNPRLIMGTLRENIILGCDNASEDEIQQALSLSHADEFVDKMGLDTLVKEGNMGISGGQAQRIAIARALLRKARFFLLDEPTASLDSASEQKILSALNHLVSKKTMLMITHRIEDLIHCDAIWIMKQGEIIQQGSLAQLQQQGNLTHFLQE